MSLEVDRRHFLAGAIGICAATVLSGGIRRHIVAGEAPHTSYIPLAPNLYVPPHTSPKKGVAPGTIPVWKTLIDDIRVSWLYAYGPYTFDVPPEASNIEVFSMWQARKITVVPPGRIRLGFNEPDIETSLVPAVSPEEAAVLWHDYVEQFADQLVSPAPSQRHPEWLEQFRDAYIRQYRKPPRQDALGIHCYENLADCKRVVSYVMQLAKEWGIPQVWVTEFAFSEISDMEDFVRWMEAQPLIARYAWYTDGLWGNEPWVRDYKQVLVDLYTGKLTKYGEAYRRLP